MNIDWNDLFLKPSGRIGQKEFWIGSAILFAIGLINEYVIKGMAPTIVYSIIGLIMLYPGYCVLSSRFADFGKSPKLAFVPYGFMAVGLIMAVVGGAVGVSSAAAGSDGGAVGGLLGAGLGVMLLGIGWLIWLAFVIWAGVAKGDPAPNQYGPPPADPTAKAA